MNVKTMRSIQVQVIHFVGKKRIQLMQKAYIGFMKEAASLSIYMIFISKRK
ncbi:hypothetical protein CGSSpBS293_11223 [Streptococcus pneumoniae SP-BS293]|nr:hypothetical protein CGSSpBS293_11223 [Streptococcus pneumoniae SP-BS293]EFL76422.1 hypothetical protein CGSSpBS397_10785 [Streptococcus pneumoniae BS397]